MGRVGSRGSLSPRPHPPAFRAMVNPTPQDEEILKPPKSFRRWALNDSRVCRARHCRCRSRGEHDAARTRSPGMTLQHAPEARPPGAYRQMGLPTLAELLSRAGVKSEDRLSYSLCRPPGRGGAPAPIPDRDPYMRAIALLDADHPQAILHMRDRRGHRLTVTPTGAPLAEGMSGSSGYKDREHLPTLRIELVRERPALAPAAQLGRSRL